MSFYLQGGKRIFDFSVALIGLAVAALPMGLIAALIRLTMGKPVLHRISRPGLRGKPFVLNKFRTMTTARRASGELLPDRDRITRLGRILRRTSLDELPQLLNVVCGDMSLVGPRPLKMEYLPLYSERQARRHDVRPGITGLAQISGRNQLDWDARFELDVFYAANVSWRMDMKILLQTAIYVLCRRCVSDEGDLDVPSFTGSSPTSRNDELSAAVTSRV
jgi:lipopolysaccharide/colanic/teichoic acid biosynthesis glycosyltransferase